MKGLYNSLTGPFWLNVMADPVSPFSHVQVYNPWQKKWEQWHKSWIKEYKDEL